MIGHTLGLGFEILNGSGSGLKESNLTQSIPTPTNNSLTHILLINHSKTL